MGLWALGGEVNQVGSRLERNEDAVIRPEGEHRFACFPLDFELTKPLNIA